MICGFLQKCNRINVQGYTYVTPHIIFYRSADVYRLTRVQDIVTMNKYNVSMVHIVIYHLYYHIFR